MFFWLWTFITLFCTDMFEPVFNKAARTFYTPMFRDSVPSILYDSASYCVTLSILAETDHCGLPGKYSFHSCT